MDLSSCIATQDCSNASGNKSEELLHEGGFHAGRDVFQIVIAVLVIAVNSWVIWLVATKRSLRTVTNYILTSLAVSDLCTGAISIPLLLSCNILIKTGFCVADLVVIVFISVSTVLHILAMTVDRYICIIYALRYQSWVTKRRGGKLIALIWLFSMLVALIQLAWTNLNEEATMEHSAEVKRIIVIYDITLFVAVIGLPVIFMAFAYARILYEVHRQTMNIQKHNTPGWQETRRSTRQEWKVATVFLVMLLVFVICWVPYYLLQLQQVLKEQFLDISTPAVMILYWLRLLTSLINPCLYILGKPDFRKAAGLRKRTRRYNSEGTRTSLLKSSSV